MEAILEQLQTEVVAILSDKNMTDLLEQGEILREENTQLSDMIRIIDWQGTILVQEKTNRDDFTLRKMESRDQAEAFLQDRLNRYERMWDG